MTRRGKPGKPNGGFPPFPQRLEIACAIPTFPPARLRSLLGSARNGELAPFGRSLAVGWRGLDWPGSARSYLPLSCRFSYGRF